MFILQEAMKAQSGVQVQLCSFFTVGDRWSWVVNATTRPFYSRERETLHPLYRRLGGPIGPVWTGAENITTTAIRNPDRPARSESLYLLPGPHIRCSTGVNEVALRHKFIY